VPTYAYRCDSGHEFEVVQSITDEALKSCRVCGAPVRRIVFPVGIVFKGQGFYKTDSRSSSSSSIGPASGSGSESSDQKPAEAAPVAKTEAAPTSGSKPEATPGAATLSGGTSGAGEKNG